MARQFVLFFEMSDYLSEIDPTLDIFFEKVLLPGDNLMVMTPQKNYNLKADALGKKPKRPGEGRAAGASSGGTS